MKQMQYSPEYIWILENLEKQSYKHTHTKRPLTRKISHGLRPWVLQPVVKKWNPRLGNREWSYGIKPTKGTDVKLESNEEAGMKQTGKSLKEK